MRLLAATTPAGATTGGGIGPASTNDRALAATGCAARAAPQQGLPYVGLPTSDRSVADLGRRGRGCQPRWDAASGAVVVSASQTGGTRAWATAWRRWIAGIRQGIAGGNDRRLTVCGPARERPHAMDGLPDRLAVAVGLPNVCAWRNRTLGRGLLRVADLVDR